MQKSLITNFKFFISGTIFFLCIAYSKAKAILEKEIVVDKDPLDIKEINNFVFHNNKKYDPKKSMTDKTKKKTTLFSLLNCDYDENLGFKCDNYAALLFTGILFAIVISLIVFSLTKGCLNYSNNYRNKFNGVINNRKDNNQQEMGNSSEELVPFNKDENTLTLNNIESNEACKKL